MREQADIDADVAEPVEEENHAEQEQEVVIAGHHVLGAQVDERQQIGSRDFLDVALVPFRNAVGVGVSAECQKEGKTKQRQKTWSVPRMKRPRPALSRRSIHG